MTQALAAEYGPSGVRVNSVCPLRGATALLEHFSGTADTPEERERFAQTVPLRRMSTPDDISNAAVFLCSEGKWANVNKNDLTYTQIQRQPSYLASTSQSTVADLQCDRDKELIYGGIRMALLSMQATGRRWSYGLMMLVSAHCFILNRQSWCRLGIRPDHHRIE